MGPFWVCQQNQACKPLRHIARGWGIRQGKCHFVKSLDSSQKLASYDTPAPTVRFPDPPPSFWEPHPQPHTYGLLPAACRTFWQLFLDRCKKEGRRERKGETQKSSAYGFPSRAWSVKDFEQKNVEALIIKSAAVAGMALTFTNA